MNNVKHNLARIENIATLVSREIKSESGVICFPELATTGYSLFGRWRNVAETVPGDTTDKLSRICCASGLHLICGIVEKDTETNRIYDSAVLIEPTGRVLGTYRKVHLWDKEKQYFTPGREHRVFQTRLGKIGVGICYDLEFPESAREMAVKGAEILFYPSAEMRPMEKQIETYVRSRSAENCVYVAFSNRVGREGKLSFFGRSQVAAPSCKILAKAKYGENFAFARINLKDLARERKLLPYLRDLPRNSK